MTYQGFKIFYAEGDGFYWANGGYFATVEEAQADIAKFNHEEFEREIAEGRFD